MSEGMSLTIATPASLLVDATDVRSLRAEDMSGAFGVLPGHANLLTVLPPSVVRWTKSSEATFYCALSGGVLAVSGGDRVAIACRRGTVGDDLAALEAAVAAERSAELDADRRARVEQTLLHARAPRADALPSVLSLTVDSQDGAGVRVCADEQDCPDHD
jgi:F-type H+-transporting ATPase subunit epsilon